MNFCWLDSETTGRFADKHDIIQLGCIPIINGQRLESFNEYCQPASYENVDPGAIAVHGITIPKMKTFQQQSQLLDKFISYLKQFNVKFTLAGFNVGFDRRFISSMFTKHGRSDEFFALFELHNHDTYNRAQSVKKLIGSENLKLVTLAKHYGIAIDAHDAISDIAATIEVDKHIGKLLKEEEFIAEDVKEEIKISTVFSQPVQLHVHSMYGMVESVPTVEEWAEWCVKTKTPGFSIVDHGNAVSIYNMTKIKDKKNDKTKELEYPGVVAIPGAGLFMSFDMSTEDLYPVNAWAINNNGYFNLMKLSSIGYENAVEVDGISRPRLTAQQIIDHSSGLMFGTGDVYGKIGELIADGNADEAETAFERYLSLFGNKLFVEFSPLSIRATYSVKKGFQPIKSNVLVTSGDLNKAYNQFLSRMVDKHNLRCVPVSSAHFIEKNDKLIQDCISRNAYKSGKCYKESHHARTADDLYIELKHQLGDWLSEEKFLQWINNTYEISEAAKSISIKHDYHLPKIDIPDHIKAKTDDYNKQTYYLTLEKCVEHGRWNDDPVYLARFKEEIDVIMKNEKINFLPYFLLYEDICTFARSQDILQNIGRGSAGGCLLSYYLKIIHIDPVEHDLPFPRFLSHARIRANSFPDIDCDFGDRTPIIRYLEQKYGLGFAQICTFQKMKTKNAIKDAMFALYSTNREEPNLKAVCELIPDSPQGVEEYDFLYGHTDKEDTYHPGAVEIYPEVASFFKMYPSVEELVKRLIGVVRGVGRHASAYVISTLDLAQERVPTMRMYDKITGEFLRVTQFDAYMCEGCGLVKADILGVTTIDAVSDCIKLIKARTGFDYMEEDGGMALIYRLPEDKAVYRDFFNKDTDSAFTFNTSLFKGFLPKFCPTEREHLSAMNALCRPGALDAPFANDEISLEDGISAAQYYMDVRNGDRKLSYLHPDLASCTSNGVFVYQEEVMKFLVDIAGYTLEESDQIRSAIAKKKHDVMMSTFDRIRAATAKRGWTPEQANIICNQIMAFSRYSFNKSHSRCYGDLGYITMYLKHHHKLEWWTAILNNTHKEDKLRHYMTLLGTMVTPPSLAIPDRKFAINGDKIVAPLSVLKQVGPTSIDELVNKGPFTTLEDYVKRVTHNKVNVGHFSSIIQGRAADCLMDPNLPYPEAREKLMNDYEKLRSSRPFREEMRQLDPISIFLQEKAINKCFNKSLLEDQTITSIVKTKLDDLQWTGSKNTPFFRGVKNSKSKVPVVSSIHAAFNMVKKQYEGDIGLVLLFESSTYKSGISKKSKKEYNMVKASLTDGYASLECTWWDKKQPLRWPINSIVFVRGILSEGWGGQLNLTVKEMERIES